MNHLLTQAAATPPDQSTKEIQLTRGMVALVDAQDYEWLNQFSWHARRGHSTWYAIGSRWVHGKTQIIRMHRLIMGSPSDMFVDHKDGNGLNNRRSNLRLATKSQNGMNRGPTAANASGYKGIRWVAEIGKWRAAIRINGREKYLGSFATKSDAISAYAQAAHEFHGEFART